MSWGDGEPPERWFVGWETSDVNGDIGQAVMHPSCHRHPRAGIDGQARLDNHVARQVVRERAVGLDDGDLVVARRSLQGDRRADAVGGLPDLVGRAVGGMITKLIIRAAITGHGGRPRPKAAAPRAATTAIRNYSAAGSASSAVALLNDWSAR
jgi:hypothetical protein